MTTTADYLNKLVTQKNSLADNLVTMGVTASHVETLETLVPKVLDIGGSITPTEITFNGEYHVGDTIDIEVISLDSAIVNSVDILQDGITVQSFNIGTLPYFNSNSVSIPITTGISGEITIRSSNTNIGIIGVWIPFVMTPMTADITTTEYGNITATASSVLNGLSAYHAFDGIIDDDNVWHALKNAPQWISIEFPTPVCLKNFTMYNRLSYDYCPKDIIFQCSNDGEIWNDIVQFVFSDSVVGGQSKSVITDNKLFCKYYRWYISTVNEYSVISEIAFDRIFKSFYLNGNIQICSKNN